jgi:hypothetical protein
MVPEPFDLMLPGWNWKCIRQRTFSDSLTSPKVTAVNCRVLGPGHQVELEVPRAGNPTEARRVAMEIITSFSATYEDADVRVVHYD